MNGIDQALLMMSAPRTQSPRPIYRLEHVGDYYLVDSWAGTYWRNLGGFSRLEDAQSDLRIRVSENAFARAYCATHGLYLDLAKQHPCPSCLLEDGARSRFALGLAIGLPLATLLWLTLWKLAVFCVNHLR